MGKDKSCEYVLSREEKLIVVMPVEVPGIGNSIIARPAEIGDIKQFIPRDYALIHLDSVLIPRGEPMPQTIEAWQYLAHQYEKELLANRDEIAKLKRKLNNLQQKIKAQVVNNGCIRL